MSFLMPVLALTNNSLNAVILAVWGYCNLHTFVLLAHLLFCPLEAVLVTGVLKRSSERCVNTALNQNGV